MCVLKLEGKKYQSWQRGCLYVKKNSAYKWKHCIALRWVMFLGMSPLDTSINEKMEVYKMSCKSKKLLRKERKHWHVSMNLKENHIPNLHNWIINKERKKNNLGQSPQCKGRHFSKLYIRRRKHLYQRSDSTSLYNVNLNKPGGTYGKNCEQGDIMYDALSQE